MTFEYNSLRCLALTGVFMLAACNEPVPDANAPQTPPLRLMENTAVTADLRDLGDGSWAVDYFFAEPKQAVFFPRSSGDYRMQTWTPQADSPPVERLNGLDAIVFAEPSQTASYVVRPYTEDVMGDYTPWIAFSDGALGVFTGQFELLDGGSRELISGLQGNLAAWSGDQGVLGVRFETGQPLLVASQIKSAPVETFSSGEGEYVVIGETEIDEGQSYIGVVDRALPPEILESLDGDLGQIFAHYEDEFGYGLPSRASLLFAFGGFEAPGYSFSGSVIGDDQIMMSVEGDALQDYPPGIRRHILWFFAHEGAHLFQGSEGAMPGLGADSWIHEGSANVMAVETILAMDAGDENYRRAELNLALGGCAMGLSEGPLNSLVGQVHYDCGQLIFTMADAALPNVSVYGIWRAIQNASASDEAGGVTAELVFSVFSDLGLSDVLIDQMERLVLGPSADPWSDILVAMETSGISLEVDEQGQLIASQMP